LILVENLATCGRRLKNKELSILGADIKLSIGQHRRSLLDRSKILQPKLLAGIYIERRNVGAIVDLIEPIPIKHR